jgi:hypothetical protein
LQFFPSASVDFDDISMPLVPTYFYQAYFWVFKLGLPVGLGRPTAGRGLRPLLTQSGSPNLNTQK